MTKREAVEAWIVDDTGFAKQGPCSVGVQRQYSGTLGKTGNCQVTVNCHYAERTLAWPVATRLYLPKEWANDADRRKKAHVPDEVDATVSHNRTITVCPRSATGGSLGLARPQPRLDAVRCDGARPSRMGREAHVCNAAPLTP